jgi:hypothetical protein
MSRASELAALLAADMADVDEVVAEILRLERVNAELVEALKGCADFIAGPTAWTQEQVDLLNERVHETLARAALTSATKEQQK